MSRFLLCIVLLVFPLAAAAEKRVALIIGNDSYAEVPVLQKAVADALAMADQLSNLGFETVLATDVSRRDFNLAMADFTSRLEPGDTAFVFYAGHGVEIEGENYLLPADILAPNDVQPDLITSESIPLSGLLDRIRRTGARTTLAVIDACRDNPFSTSTGRSIGRSRGLGRISAPEGTFVMYSAGAGQQALDRLNDNDSNPNSVFTRNLLPKLAEPGLELRDLIAELRVEVRDLARSQDHAQFPAYYDELLGDFYFTSASQPVVAQTSEVASNSDAPTRSTNTIRDDFEMAREVGSAAALRAFLAQHEGKSTDFSIVIAREMLLELTGEEVVSTAPPTNTTDESGTDFVDLDAKSRMRKTQEELNRLGCNAGGADGVVGRRTRAAFSAYIDQSGSNLTADALGSRGALEELAATSGTVCEAASVAVSASPTLAGTWSYRSVCALVIKGTGTLQLRHAGGDTYVGTFNDSLGNNGSVTYTLSGRNFSGSSRTATASAREWGTLSTDGNSYVLSNSLTCKTNGSRVR